MGKRHPKYSKYWCFQCGTRLNTKIYRCLDVQVSLSTVVHPSQIQQTSGKRKPKNLQSTSSFSTYPSIFCQFLLETPVHSIRTCGAKILQACLCHVAMWSMEATRTLSSAEIAECLCDPLQSIVSKQQNMVLTQMLRIGFAILVYMYDGCIFLCRHIFCRAYGIVNFSPSNGCSQNPAPVLLWVAAMVSQQVIYRSWLKQDAMERCITPESTPLPCAF